MKMNKTKEFSKLKSRIWFLGGLWVMLMHFIYLLGREDSFSNAAGAMVKLLPFYIPLLIAIWFAENQKKKHDEDIKK
jgi:hypothetical protein